MAVSTVIREEGEYEYYLPQPIPFRIPVVFQNFEYKIDITQVLKRAALVEFEFYCRGSYGCKYITIKLLDANENVRVKATLDEVYRFGSLARNPGGTFPFVAYFSDSTKTYSAMVNPTLKVFLEGIELQLTIPPVSVINSLLPQGQSVSVGEQAIVEIAFLIEAIKNSFIWGRLR